MSQYPAGWARPLASRKHHYFEEDTTISICGRWMLARPEREPDDFESADDCKACRRKIEAKKRPERSRK